MTSNLVPKLRTDAVRNMAGTYSYTKVTSRGSYPRYTAVFLYSYVVGAKKRKSGKTIELGTFDTSSASAVW